MPMETKNLADLYELAPLSWPDIASRLEGGYDLVPGSGGPDRHSCWLTTLNPDGSPHVTGLGALWVDGAFWFETGERSRKGRNLARDPRCALSLALNTVDLVVEGVAELIADKAVVADMAQRWAEGGWPCRVDDSGLALTADFSAPSAGSPPWRIYRIAATAASAVGVDPGGATRWTFD
ncbi:pyridoxamine 5'-phosphate oxidase family protein [Nocardia albiluteola]|nr:pyridoxamine 5'-phosphate oxidase family protein [Nocardia albiluteola]